MTVHTLVTPGSSSADRFARRLLQAYRAEPAPLADGIDEARMVRRAVLYRKGFRSAALSLPASVLHSGVMVDWVQRNGVSVDVCSVEDVDIALSRGVSTKQLVLQCRENTDRRTVLRAAAADIVRVCIDCAAPGWERLAADVIERSGMELIGLHRRLERADDATALMGMVAGLSLINHRHGVLLGRLSLSGLTFGSVEDVRALRRVADALYEMVGDGCARFRCARPVLALTPAPEALN